LLMRPLSHTSCESRPTHPAIFRSLLFGAQQAGILANMKATWKPYSKHGRLTAQADLPDSAFAFPKQRKEPMTDANHVRNAIARFDQVLGVSDADRDLAWANVLKAAKYFGVDVNEKSWRELLPSGRPVKHRKRKPTTRTRRSSAATAPASSKRTVARRKRKTSSAQTRKTSRGSSRRTGTKQAAKT
jgi:hypothetical protein